MHLEFTPEDFDEAKQLAVLFKKIDAFELAYVNEVTDDIYQRQPFFLSVLLGYHLDVKPLELEEIMKSYFLIWEYFKNNKNIQKRKITERMFDKMQYQNISTLKQTEGKSEAQKISIFREDYQNLKSKALLAAIMYQFRHQPNLSKMESDTKGIILIGIKAFIQCFEMISSEKKIPS